MALPAVILTLYLGLEWLDRSHTKPLSLTTLRAHLTSLPAHVRTIGLRVVGSALALLVVAVPWHHAMYIRHGAAWWDELYGDNHWRRLMIGRHGDRGTFAYFLREIGFGTFPSTPLFLVAVAIAVTREFRSPNARRLATLGIAWAVGVYGVLSLSMTKFHHYILPALPGLALVLAAVLDDLRQDGTASSRQASLWPIAALVGLPLIAVITFDVAQAKEAGARFTWLFSYDYVHSVVGRPWPGGLDFRIALGVLAAIAALALIARALLPRANATLPLSLFLVGLCATVFLLDRYMPAVTAHWSQKPLIARYFRERGSANEPLAAYQMFWRGETFYTKNAINEGPPEDRMLFDYHADTDERLRRFLAARTGRVFVLYPIDRDAHLRRLIPPGAAFAVIESDNNKFRLATIDPAKSHPR